MNPSIALGVKPLELADPLAQYGKIAAIQQAQNQNALVQYQLSAAQRGEEETNKLRALFGGATDVSSPEFVRQVYAVSPEYGAKHVKALGEQEKLRQAAIESRLKVATEKTKLYRDQLANVNDPQSAQAWITAQFQDPDLKDVTKNMPPLEQVLAKIPTDPAQFNTWRQQQALGMGKFIELNRPILSTTDTGSIVKKEAWSPLTQELTTVGTEKKTMTPGDAARLVEERKRVGLEERRVDLAEGEAKLKREGLEGISPKELQKREAAFPQATQAINSFDASADSFIKDLKALRDHPGLSEITGVAAGRLPGFTASGRAAQALYDKVLAKGGFQALQSLREASKTGGALGNVSNQEGRQLQASFAAVDRRQDVKDVQEALDRVVGDIEGAKVRTREAYDMTYDYRNRRAPTSPTPGAPTPPKPGVPKPAAPTVSNW